ncbi:phasin family protein [Bradyrhizobium sp. CCBAU 51753]|uniref:phasin family protein n=1 Tax=Bradyrhizobium sp. CCBAU 51753 TaxID=1325100 RepID=UPI001FF07336|nr:phasin family protein [Bradyrhizobium sp. CCBAU 51753]
MKVTVNGTNIFGMPLLGFPKIALPGVVGDLAAESFARARTSEHMTEALSETYSRNAAVATDYGLKVLEISHANTAFAFDLFAHLLGSGSASEVLTLSTEQARKAFDQNEELWKLGQRLATDMRGQVKKHFDRTLHHAA